MKRRMWVATALVIAAVFSVAQPAAAEPSVVSLDDAKPDLTEKDGSWTTSLGLTNLTDGDVTVTPSTTRDGSCTLTLGDSPPEPEATIPAAEHATVKVNISAGCDADEEDFTFRVSAVGLTKPFTIDPEPAKPKTPEWGHLLVFPFALLLLLAAGLKLVGAKTFPEPDEKEQSPEGSQSVSGKTGHHKAAGDGGKQSLKSKLRHPMSHLHDSWSFKESWATNLTVAGALLTGVFGSADVVEAFLGEDADSGIALATVGSAIATGFVGVGAGAVVLLALRNGKGTTTVAGLLVAAAVTTAGAFGQLWVGFWSGLDFELDGIQYVLMAALVLAMALLLVYAWRTFTLNLAEGTDPPEPEPQKDYLKPPLSETIFATRMLVEALMARDDIPHSTADELLKRLPSLHAVETYPAYGNSPGDDPPRPRRRAALL